VSWVAGLSKDATLVSSFRYHTPFLQLRLILGASIESIVVAVRPERTNGKADCDDTQSKQVVP